MKVIVRLRLAAGVKHRLIKQLEREKNAAARLICRFALSIPAPTQLIVGVLESILTRAKMWINIAIIFHIGEVYYENHPDDT